MTDVSLDDVEHALLNAADPVVTASEIADAVDCSRRHALDLLRLLEHAGDAKSKKVGARAIAWWHTERVRARVPDDASSDEPDRAESPHDQEREQERERDVDRDADPDGTIDTREQPSNEQADTPGVVADVVEQATETWDDSPDRTKARKDAAVAVLTALRDESMSKSEIIERFYEEHPVDGQNEVAWWRKNLAEGDHAPLKAVAEYNRGTHKWTWTGVDEE